MSRLEAFRFFLGVRKSSKHYTFYSNDSRKMKQDRFFVLLPREKKFHPAEKALQWRRERLIGNDEKKLKY